MRFELSPFSSKSSAEAARICPAFGRNFCRPSIDRDLANHNCIVNFGMAWSFAPKLPDVCGVCGLRRIHGITPWFRSILGLHFEKAPGGTNHTPREHRTAGRRIESVNTSRHCTAYRHQSKKKLKRLQRYMSKNCQHIWQNILQDTRLKVCQDMANNMSGNMLEHM